MIARAAADAVGSTAVADPIPATVMVLSRNSAATLREALDSVVDFAEIIVCDGGSTDDTIGVARRAGARVIDQDPRFQDATGRLRDYAGARLQVVEAASQPWVLHLDADERATPDLVAALRVVAETSEPAAYRCTAHHLVDGTSVASAANYPMWYLRFFHRDSVTGYLGPINERPEFAEGVPVRDLDESFLIPMPPLRAVLRKWARYQRIVLADGRHRSPAEWWREERPRRWREVRWLAWRVWKSRRAEPGPHMPLRYDVARVGFHLAGMVSSGLGACLPVGRMNGGHR